MWKFTEFSSCNILGEIDFGRKAKQRLCNCKISLKNISQSFWNCQHHGNFWFHVKLKWKEILSISTLCYPLLLWLVFSSSSFSFQTINLAMVDVRLPPLLRLEWRQRPLQWRIAVWHLLLLLLCAVVPLAESALPIVNIKGRWGLGWAVSMD